MEAIQAWIVANWIVPAATTGLGLLGGIALKIAAKYLSWVTDNHIKTLLKGLFSGKYQTRASDKLPPMDERGEAPSG